jgi:hypothetical protein
LVLRLLEHWRDLSGDRDMPAVADISGAQMSDMWDYCFLLDLRDGSPRFLHFGAWHAEFYGKDMAGASLADLTKDTLAERSARYLDEVLARRVPITYGAEAVEPGGRKILYRSILMPLSEDGGKITGILGGSNCKLVDDPAVG